MNADQMATYQMIHGVKEHGESQPDAWSGSVPFTNGFTHFKNRLAVLDGYIPQQQSPATVRAQKKDMQVSLRGALNTLVTGLRSFGYDHNRQDVLDMARYTPSDITRMTLTDLAAVSETLHGKVNELLNGKPPVSLSDYGITEDTQTTLGNYISGFNTLKGQEKAARAVPIEATAQIAALLTEITGILDNRLDNAAELLRAAQPEFVAQYFIVRRIDDAHHQALALMVRVMDGAGAPVEKALIVLPNGVKRKTTAKGACQVQNLPDGSYNITISKEGYATVTQPVVITGGETEIVTVVLAKA